MKWNILYIFLLFSCFCYSQTNRNEDFVLKGIQAAKEQKYGLAISYLQFSLKDKNLPDSTKISGEFYLQYAYRNTNNPKFSIEKLDSVVAKYPNYKDSIATFFIRDMAYSLSQSEYYSKALEYGKQATERIKWLYGDKSLEYAYSLDNLSLRYTDCNMLDSAMSKVQKAGIIIKQLKGKKDIDYAHNLNNLATIYNENEQYEEAIKYRKQAINIVKNTDDVIFHAILLDNIGCDYWNNSDIQLAIEHNEQALNVLSKNKSYTSDYIITLLNLADKYSGLNNYEKANNYYKKGLLETKKIKGTNNPIYANTMIKLAMNYCHMGEYNSFCNYSDSAIFIMDNIYDKNNPQYLYYQKEVINRYLQNEDYARAKDRIEYILGNNINLAPSDSIYYYKHLSTCHSVITWDYIKALEFVDKAITIANSYYDFEAPNDLLSFSGLIHNKASLLMECGFCYNSDKSFNKAKEYIDIALSIRQDLLEENDPLLINSLNLLICIYQGLKKIEESINLCTYILSEVKNLDNMSRASVLKNLASAYKEKGDYGTAIEICNEAIKEDEVSLHMDSYIEWMYDLSSLYYENNQHEMAVSVINKIVSYMETNIPEISIIDDNERINTWIYNRLYIMLPQWIEESGTNLYNNLGYDSALKFKNFHSHLTSIVMGNSIYNESEETYQKYEKFNKLNREINLLKEEGNTRNINIDSLNTQIYRLKKELLKTSIGYNNVNLLLNIDWEDIQKILNPNDISIEFIEVKNDKYIALLLKKDWKEVQAIRFTIPKDISFKEQYIKVWEPIKDYISPGDNIYFSASGILHQIPIESLPIGDGKIMSDVYNIHRLSSTRELVKEKKEVKYTKAALYGGLNYDMTDNELLAENQTYSKNASEEYFVSRGLLEDSIRGYKWDKLSNTQQEVDYISDLMKKNQITTQTYKGNKGNEESFKALSGHEYNIIHLATHGFFYPDEEAKEKDYFKPMLLNDNYRMYNEVDMSMWRSGLVMSGGNRAWNGDTIPDTVEDGILKAQEIGDLDLRGADLVVLSACNTGQGEVTGEGVFGLQRAFKMAGAQTIIMSLTPVDDQTTMAMMNKFYTNLFSGQSKHDAFYNAQRYIRSIKPDPKYWMGWIMLD